MSRGGSRPGAGRKPGPPRQRIQVRMDADFLRRIDRALLKLGEREGRVPWRIDFFREGVERLLRLIEEGGSVEQVPAGTPRLQCAFELEGPLFERAQKCVEDGVFDSLAGLLRTAGEYRARQVFRSRRRPRLPPALAAVSTPPVEA